jgi:hypothetical protein
MIETIAFKNKIYPVKTIELPKSGKVLIATTKLSSVLLTNNSEYKSELARIIDEQIYFYIEPKQIYWTDIELINFLIKETW